MDRYLPAAFWVSPRDPSTDADTAAVGLCAALLGIVTLALRERASYVADLNQTVMPTLASVTKMPRFCWF
jgi:hypothetical protein